MTHPMGEVLADCFERANSKMFFVDLVSKWYEENGGGHVCCASLSWVQWRLIYLTSKSTGKASRLLPGMPLSNHFQMWASLHWSLCSYLWRTPRTPSAVWNGPLKSNLDWSNTTQNCKQGLMYGSSGLRHVGDQISWKLFLSSWELMEMERQKAQRKKKNPFEIRIGLKKEHVPQCQEITYYDTMTILFSIAFNIFDFGWCFTQRLWKNKARSDSPFFNSLV